MPFTFPCDGLALVLMKDSDGEGRPNALNQSGIRWLVVPRWRCGLTSQPAAPARDHARVRKLLERPLGQGPVSGDLPSPAEGLFNYRQGREMRTCEGAGR